MANNYLKVVEYQTTRTDYNAEQNDNVQTEWTEPANRDRSSQVEQAAQGGQAVFTLY